MTDCDNAGGSFLSRQVVCIVFAKCTTVHHPVIGGIDLSSCRLCGSVGDARHCKNLFKAANADILTDVERLNEKVLSRDKELPQLICRLCERKGTRLGRP